MVINSFCHIKQFVIGTSNRPCKNKTIIVVMEIQISVGKPTAENLSPESAVFSYILEILHTAIHHCIHNPLRHITCQLILAHLAGADTAETHTRTVGSRILMAKTNCSSIPAFVKHSPT